MGSLGGALAGSLQSNSAAELCSMNTQQALTKLIGRVVLGVDLVPAPCQNWGRNRSGSVGPEAYTVGGAILGT